MFLVRSSTFEQLTGWHVLYNTILGIYATHDIRRVDLWSGHRWVGDDRVNIWLPNLWLINVCCKYKALYMAHHCDNITHAEHTAQQSNKLSLIP